MARDIQNTTSPKVSFIVPVYNVEAYVEQCIRSILERTMCGFYSMALKAGTLVKKGYTHNKCGDDFYTNEVLREMALYKTNVNDQTKQCANNAKINAVLDKYNLREKLKV